MNQMNEHGRVDVHTVQQEPYSPLTAPNPPQGYYVPPQAPPPPRAEKKRNIAGIVIACSLCTALVGGAMGGIGGVALGYALAPKQAQSAQIEQEPLSSVMNQQPPSTSSVAYSSAQDLLSVNQIAQVVTPSVVAIDVTATQTQMTPFGRMENEVSGGGSGVILSQDGYIVTNNHVVEGAQTITVYLYDGQEYEARLIGRDAKTDIAVIKVEAQGLTPATFGSSAGVQVGDMAVAIGNPLGRLAGTVTQGIISALEREIVIGEETMTLLQFDAAINQGNSGGALVDGHGQVVGIVNAKASAIGVEGIGFALPMDYVKDAIDDIVRIGYVSGRPKIGIAGRDVTPEISQAYGLPEGAYIAEVEEFSAAEQAGMRVGDVIIAVDGREIKTWEEIEVIKNEHKPGDTIPITVMRGEKEVELMVTLMEDVQN